MTVRTRRQGEPGSGERGVTETSAPWSRVPAFTWTRAATGPGLRVPGLSERSVATAGWRERVAGGAATTVPAQVPAHSGLRLEGRRGARSGLTFKTSAGQREGTDRGGRGWGTEEQEGGGLGQAGAGSPGDSHGLYAGPAAGGSPGGCMEESPGLPWNSPPWRPPSQEGGGRRDEAAGAAEAGARPRLSQP